jgi:acetolactate synthase I/II/III large subunit
MPKKTGGHVVVESLKREGVEIVFGLPGVQIMDVFDAFYKDPDIRLITARHEQSTVYMADGYARTKGKPGVALVVPGPGVQNASAALGTAYACSSPVLLIAGQVESHNLGKDKGALHEINDQLDIIKPVTKWCRRVMTVEEIPLAIHEAMQQMRTGRPRPTEVEIPWDVLRKEGEGVSLGRAQYPRIQPNREDLRRAAKLLGSAKRPLIWAGGGVIFSEASPELIALAEFLGAPVATTPEGKGAIPEDHPLSLGAGYYGFGSSRFATPQVDVVLAVGTRLTSQMHPGTGLHPPQKLIHIDVDPSVIGKNYPAEVAIAADAQTTLKALLEEMQRFGVPPDRWPMGELPKMRDQHLQWLRGKAGLQLEIIHALRKEMEDEAILVSGVTNIGYWCNLAFAARHPRTYLTSSYFATLGYAFPTAIGAKCAAPDKPVVGVVGDGGFMYALGELATAVRYGIRLVIVVFTDNAFGSTKSEQEIRFQGRVAGTELNNPDFARLAELFGAKGMKSDPEGLGGALREALKAKEPVVIEVPMPTLIAPFQIPSTV